MSVSVTGLASAPRSLGPDAATGPAGGSSVLFVSLMNGAPWGGSEELWWRTALHAARAGRRVGCAVYGWLGKTDRLDALRRAGCEVLEIPNRGRARRTVAEKLLYEVLVRLRQRASLRRLPLGGYDVVVLNQGGPSEVAASALVGLDARLRRYALTFHSYRENLALRPSHAARLRRWVLGSAANLFASMRIRDVLESQLDVKIPNADVLLNPIGFEPGEAAAPAPGPPWRLAMLASLDVRSKAQDRLIEALARPEWRARDVVLELWGAGPDELLLRALVERLGLGEKVRFMGHTSDPRAALRRAHLFLQASLVDAMPISVVEAMAVGRPVVVNRIGDMPAWIEDGASGFVCEDASTERIAAVLEEAWRRRDDWAAMGERAHRRFRERYPASPEARFLEQVTGERA